MAETLVMVLFVMGLPCWLVGEEVTRLMRQRPVPLPVHGGEWVVPYRALSQLARR